MVAGEGNMHTYDFEVRFADGTLKHYRGLSVRAALILAREACREHGTPQLAVLSATPAPPPAAIAAELVRKAFHTVFREQIEACKRRYVELQRQLELRRRGMHAHAHSSLLSRKDAAL
jgi:hypothetical protein